MKHILLINKFYYPIIGGVETVVRQYAEIASKEHTVTVLTVQDKFSLKTVKEKINNVNVIRCSSLGTFLSMPVSASFYFHFFLLRRKADIIHFHEPFPLASLLSLLPKKKKYIVTWHSDIIKQKFIRWFFEIFQKRLCKISDRITTTSPVLSDYSRILKHINRQKIEVIPLSIYCTSELTNECPVPELSGYEGQYMLYLGRLSYYKGIQWLVDVVEKADDLPVLFIIGEGLEANLIRMRIQGKSNKIKFVNRFLSEGEKNYCLKNCLFFLFPSIMNSEAFGIMQLEAMYYSKPVINTQLPTGVPWVSLDKITGLTVSPLDDNSLYKAMKNLAGNEDLIELYGKNARMRVISQFSNDVVLPHILKLYEDICQDSSRKVSIEDYKQ